MVNCSHTDTILTLKPNNVWGSRMKMVSTKTCVQEPTHTSPWPQGTLDWLTQISWRLSMILTPVYFPNSCPTLNLTLIHLKILWFKIHKLAFCPHKENNYVTMLNRFRSPQHELFHRPSRLNWRHVLTSQHFYFMLIFLLMFSLHSTTLNSGRFKHDSWINLL